jgi:hypothetical protein
MQKMLLGLAAGLLLIAAWAGAQAEATDIKAIAQVSETEKCVAPKEEMRRTHMQKILHQRDETMHKGIRTTRHSLQSCVNCHVTKDDAGQVVDISNPKHFCSSCHKYAAVSIDCFQCHNSKPTDPVVTQPVLGNPDFIHPVPLQSSTEVSQ